MDLHGKIALVTGGAHRLGRSIGLALAQEGCHLMVHYHGAQKAALETVEMAKSLGVNAISFRADLSKTTEIHALFDAVDEQFGGLDLLVNSAAVFKRRPIFEVDEELWDQTLSINLKAPFFCLQEAANRMISRGGGAVVNIADVLGLRPSRGYSVHAISKAGIELLTRSAALELAPSIRVNAIAPGLVLKPGRMKSERWDELARETPLERGGMPEDISKTVVFLFKNDFITGTTIVVDGGMNLV
jgi:pteridine reductase